MQAEKKIRVGLVFGGKSIEHEISILSATSILRILKQEYADKYECMLIGIDLQGGWHACSESLESLIEHDVTKALAIVTPGDLKATEVRAGLLSSLDVVFPILHGPYGEDGTIQGLLKLAGIPFVGAGVLASAVGMDKEIMKKLFIAAGLPVAPFLVLHRGKQQTSFANIVEMLGLPFFVKPANAGSSVGVSKVHKEEEFEPALAEAFSYDHKVIVETFVQGREIECAVLGNEEPIASIPGEIIPRHEFYSYEAKYLDTEGAELVVPALLSAKLTQEIQTLSIHAFQAICCEGMARVDMFLTQDERVVLNEINTIPGFTQISMYPKMWEASGISYAALLDRLIELALKREEVNQLLKTTCDIRQISCNTK